MNEARKIIIKSMIDHPNNWKKAADTALKQLREFVEGKKNPCIGDHDKCCYEQAKKDIADMIYKEEK